MTRQIGVLTLMCVVLFSANNASASYVNYLTDQSAEWIGNPAGRQAATDSVDGVVYNPAGLCRMKQGLHVHFSSQFIDNHYEIEVKDPAYPAQKKTEQNKPSKFVPAFYTNYRHDNWAVFGGLHIYGGGGSLYFEDGTPNLNMAVYGVEYQGEVSGYSPWTNGKSYFGTDATTGDTTGAGVSTEMLSMMPAATLGVSFALNNMVSVAAGGRCIYGIQTVKIQAREAGMYGDKDTLFDARWTAMTGTAFASLNVRPVKPLNLSVMLESWAPMKWDINVETDLSTGGALQAASGYHDERQFRYDIPAKLYLGAEYILTETFKVSGMFLLHMSQWGEYKKPSADNSVTGKTTESDYDLDPGWEIGAGFDWEFLKNIHWTAGVVFDCMNYADEYNTEMVMKNDLICLGTGIKVRTESGFNIMISYDRNIYFEEKNDNWVKDLSGKTYKTVYNKYANVVAISIEYKFL